VTLQLFGLVLVTLLMCSLGCSQPKPVLYPNAHLQSVGQEGVDRDI
jgi:hypothetical protein